VRLDLALPLTVRHDRRHSWKPVGGPQTKLRTRQTTLVETRVGVGETQNYGRAGVEVVDATKNHGARNRTGASGAEATGGATQTSTSDIYEQTASLRDEQLAEARRRMAQMAAPASHHRRRHRSRALRVC
jgi:hypothetical protein